MSTEPTKLIVGIASIFLLIGQPSHAGPLKWLKKGTDYLTDKVTKRKNTANYQRDVDSKILTRNSLTDQAGRASTAFQVGAYTFSGVMIFNAITRYGYASTGNSEYEDKKVVDEVAIAAASEQQSYMERYCVDPDNGQRFVVPSTNKVCPDGSSPNTGNGIDLAMVRSEAKQ